MLRVPASTYDMGYNLLLQGNPLTGGAAGPSAMSADAGLFTQEAGELFGLEIALIARGILG